MEEPRADRADLDAMTVQQGVDRGLRRAWKRTGKLLRELGVEALIGQPESKERIRIRNQPAARVDNLEAGADARLQQRCSRSVAEQQLRSDIPDVATLVERERAKLRRNDESIAPTPCPQVVSTARQREGASGASGFIDRQARSRGRQPTVTGKANRQARRGVSGARTRHQAIDASGRAIRERSARGAQGERRGEATIGIVSRAGRTQGFQCIGRQRELPLLDPRSAGQRCDLSGVAILGDTASGLRLRDPKCWVATETEAMRTVIAKRYAACPVPRGDGS